MNSNKKIILPMNCNKIETKEMPEIYGGKRKTDNFIKNWLLELLKKKK